MGYTVPLIRCVELALASERTKLPMLQWLPVALGGSIMAARDGCAAVLQVALQHLIVLNPDSEAAHQAKRQKQAHRKVKQPLPTVWVCFYCVCACCCCVGASVAHIFICSL